MNGKRAGSGGRGLPGGGSHTAFTAGVLEALMVGLPPQVEIVALTGTSGGGDLRRPGVRRLVRNDPSSSVRKLQGFWKAMSARDPLDQIVNHMMMGINDLRDRMVMPEVSPYNLPTWLEKKFRALLNEYFNFEEDSASWPDDRAFQSCTSAPSRC